MITGNGQFLQQDLIPTSLGPMRTIIIGHRMAEDSIKPGERTLLVNEAPRSKLRGITELNSEDFSEGEANPVASYGECQVQRMGALDRFGEALLQDIVHDNSIADSTANKLPEGGLVLQKSLNDPICSRLLHLNSSPITSSHRHRGCSG